VNRAALVASVVLLTACAAPVPAEPTPKPVAAAATPAPIATPVVVQTVPPYDPGVPAIVVRALASPKPVSLPLAILAGRSGADVRVTLDRLLQEQVYLTVLGMDAASNARLDDLLGVSSALDQGAIVLSEIVWAVKGQPAAESFLAAWRGQNADLLQYAQGQTSAARTDLGRRSSAIAEQLALGDTSGSVIEDLLRTRNQAQLGLDDATLSHNPRAVSQGVRLVASNSDELGRPLAAAIAAELPNQAPAPTEGPDITMRLGWNRLLVEHIYLTGAAVEAAADGRVLDAQARAGAASDSADELGQQLAQVWGPDLGSGLADHLRAETATLVALASGTGHRAQATTDLDHLRGEIDGLLAAANPLLPKGMLSQQVRPTDQALLAAADAFAARDFSTAYARLREAARATQKPADTVALSIIDRFPGRYLLLPTPAPTDSPPA
jgi:hypothetical protein